VIIIISVYQILKNLHKILPYFAQYLNALAKDEIKKCTSLFFLHLLIRRDEVGAKIASARDHREMKGHTKVQVQGAAAA